MGKKLVIVGLQLAEYIDDGFEFEDDYADIEQVNPTFANEYEVMAFLMSHTRSHTSDPEVSVLFQDTTPQVTLALLLLRALPVRVGLVLSKPGERPASLSSTFDVEDVELCDVVVQALKFTNPRAAIVVDGPNITVRVESPRRPEFERIVWVTYDR